MKDTSPVSVPSSSTMGWSVEQYTHVSTRSSSLVSMGTAVSWERREEAVRHTNCTNKLRRVGVYRRIKTRY